LIHKHKNTILKKIGITGGIGAGKSVVGHVLEAMHFPVYYSDQESKKLVDSHPQIREELQRLLGNEIYLDNRLNRVFLAEKIFTDSLIREEVNAIIHPYVRLGFEKWAASQNSKLVFNEAAILFETGAYKIMDATILVTAPLELKIQRVQVRDRIAAEKVLERMANQWKDEKKIPLTDYVLVNDGIQPLLSQIEAAITRLLN
jgi:dephospho-CoA kinase